MTKEQALKRLIEISPEIAEWSKQDQSIFALCYLHGRQDAMLFNQDQDSTPELGLGANTPGAEPDLMNTICGNIKPETP